MKKDVLSIIKSWGVRDNTINSTESILEWIRELNSSNTVKVKEIPLSEGDYWYYNSSTGSVENKGKKFFSIKGLRYTDENRIVNEQPIIIQPEIGFLGIICQIKDGVMYFLMQAKIEPGNVNCVQISPTIQATKSNFERAHGGKTPNYYHYFESSKKHMIICDQIQSEQGTRFYKKRNRNIIIRVDEEIEVLDNYKWMTLGQLKDLMNYDNLVNMDTRTVLSLIPYSTYIYTEEELERIREYVHDDGLYRSLFENNIQDSLSLVYNYMNDIKMFSNIEINLIGLNKLKSWEIKDNGIFCKHDANFAVKYFDIEIGTREVRYWTQPLVVANGMGTFGLMYCKHKDSYRYLVSVRREIGAFDFIEIGPTIFREAVDNTKKDKIINLFEANLESGKGIVRDSLFSEEGGRFYHEQNRNVIMEIDYIPQDELPEGYFWMSLSSLNSLVQVNNCLNIQLRNLISAIDIKQQ